MGMGMHGVIFGLVHAVVLLTVSFFVLLAVSKTDSQVLKTFGYTIAVLLWVSAALTLGTGLRGRHPMQYKMQMMQEKMEHPMMHGEMPGPAENPPAK